MEQPGTAPFDNARYVALQAERIRDRIGQFGGKLYLEFGGKLADDHHASRVLPGFAPDAKLSMLLTLRDMAEVIICVCAKDIEKNKVRGDLGIPYEEDVLRLADFFESRGLPVAGVALTRFAGQPKAEAFRRRLETLGIPCKLHYPIEGYPNAVDRIVSPDGFGRNEFIETDRPLVVVTAPGPGSGKLATCLSQLYHEHERGVEAGYAKYETFPVWNLPLAHPVNIAYEAATADLGDYNCIDPFQLAATGETAVNYNRDVESFPVVQALMERIQSESPYASPTQMGVNMVGFGIVDDEACQEAAKREIVRRYFAAACHVKRTGEGQNQVGRLETLMRQAGVTPDYLPAREVALAKAAATGAPAGALALPDGSIVTGRTSELLGAASSTLVNACKAVTGQDPDLPVLDQDALEPICELKTDYLQSKNPRLHSDETLIALSYSSATNPMAERVIQGLPRLRGCDAFFSVILSPTDEEVYRRLGINVSCEPAYEGLGYYHR